MGWSSSTGAMGDKLTRNSSLKVMYLETFRLWSSLEAATDVGRQVAPATHDGRIGHV